MSTVNGRKRVQVHVPYPLLIEKLDYIISEEINPEVYLDGEFLDNVTAPELAGINAAFAIRGLSITMHGPYMDINPGSLDEAKRLYTVKKYERVFFAAEHLKPRNIVLHAGYHERRYSGGVDEWMSQSMKTWPAFVKEAERLNTVIAVENIFEKEPSTLKRLMTEIDSPNFRICIDSGHLNVFSSVPMEEWFSSLGQYIAEVHLHDNSGNADDHLPLGEGAIDFKMFFRLLAKYAKDPVYTIEPHGEDIMRRAIAAIRNFI